MVPMMFILYINDIARRVHLQMRMFAYHQLFYVYCIPLWNAITGEAFTPSTAEHLHKNSSNSDIDLIKPRIIFWTAGL